MKKLILLLLPYFFSLVSLGQSPKTISYQGVARNTTGQPISNQSIKIKLSLLETATSSNSLYTETHTPTTTGQGLFALQIGAGTVLSGTYLNLDWSNGPKFVKTEIDPTGGDNFTLSSTNPLNAVPFALFASSGTPGPQGLKGDTGARGPIGPQGIAGQNGSNGKNALIRTTQEAVGINCPYGGVKIEVGLDFDGDSLLDDNEVNNSQTRYVCNSSGIGLPPSAPYGPTSLFNCNGVFQYSPCVPKVSTGAVSNIFSRAASFSGSVLNNGGSNVTSVGFCWSTSPNPNTSDSIAFINNPDQTLFTGGDGRFNPNTNYYVKAFAINSSGIGFGEERIFTTGNSSNLPPIDVDGITYQTITIGTQVWMKENLKVSKYRNGDIIPTDLSNSQWETTTSGAYAIYLDNSINNSIFGKLYNWHSVSDPRGLCPVGWHIPSDAEWSVLSDFLGGEGIAGGKMKAIGNLANNSGLWQNPNVGATNESGFTGLPGEYRYSDGLYYPQNGLGWYGVWWSSSRSSPTYRLYRGLYSNANFLQRSGSQSTFGASVRCIRD